MADTPDAGHEQVRRDAEREFAAYGQACNAKVINFPLARKPPRPARLIDRLCEEAAYGEHWRRLEVESGGTLRELKLTDAWRQVWRLLRRDARRWAGRQLSSW